MSTELTPREYELAVLERIKIAWPEPAFEVRHDIKLQGKKTRTKRQVDIAIYDRSQSNLIMLVEAKRHRRRVDAGTAGSMIAMVQDIGHIPTVMISTSGFSIAAANHLETEAIGQVTITIREAKALRWIREIKKRFAVDGEFAELSGQLVEALRRGESEPFHDVEIVFEEWCAAIDTGLSLFPVQTKSILETIASDHLDDAHRFNAIRILSENGQLEPALIKRLLEDETDPETGDLLLEVLSQT